MPHNENSRVKIPALVHLTRLDYKYISLKKYSETNLIDEDTNIFIDLFCDALNRINDKTLTLDEVRNIVNELKIMLDNTTVGSIPTAKDQVTVGSASMIRTDNVKCTIIMGLCEGEFPQSVKDTGIFSDNDKKILEDLDISLSANSYIFGTIPLVEILICLAPIANPFGSLIILTKSITLS